MSITGLAVSAVLTLSATSQAAPLGGGFHGGSFRGGFARGGGTAFRTGSGTRRNFGLHSAAGFNQRHRFFRGNRVVFFPQVVWPGYWYSDLYPYDYSYLDYGPDEDNQYWDDSATGPLKPYSDRPAVDRGPSVVIINSGASRLTDSGSHPEYNDGGYSSIDAAWRERPAVQNPPYQAGSPDDPTTVAPARAPQPAQPAAKDTPTTAHAQAGPFSKFVVVTWLQDGGKDVIYVQDTQTTEVQKITSEPNLDKFRIVEVHRNADPKLFEAIISNGAEQGSVRFRF